MVGVMGYFTRLVQRNKPRIVAMESNQEEHYITSDICTKANNSKNAMESEVKHSTKHQKSIGTTTENISNNTFFHAIQKSPKKVQDEHFVLGYLYSILDLIPSEICVINHPTGSIIYSNEAFRNNIATTGQSVTNIFDMVATEDLQDFQTFVRNFNFHQGVSCADFLTKMLVSDVHNDAAKGAVEMQRLYNWTLTTDCDIILLTGRPVASDALYQQIIAGKYEQHSQKVIRQHFQDCFAQHVDTSRSTVPACSSSWRTAESAIQEKARILSELREAQLKLRVAEDTLETKRMFVRYVSHEVRTPLSVVVSGLQVLAALLCTNMEALSIIDDLRSACGTAVDSLNDILTYEKLDANILVTQKAQCDPVELIEQVSALFQLQAKQSGISLQLINHIEEGSVVSILADSTKISQVARNLVSNAIKFTPEYGQVTLTMQLDKGSQRFRLEVQDTGPGMTRGQRQKLFHQIVQFNPKELQNGQSSGLGLFLARKIVDLHGGSIGVDLDWSGPGSIFYLELPCTTTTCIASTSSCYQQAYSCASTAMSTPTITPKHVLRRPSSLPVAVDGRSLRILIVDDGVLCRKFHKRVLASLGNTIVEAGNGQEAVDKVTESIQTNKPFGAILMDSSMPFMDGLTATRLIRNMGHSGLIFGVTGNAFQSDIDAFLDSGADEVVIKPLGEDRYNYIDQKARAAVDHHHNSNSE